MMMGFFQIILVSSLIAFTSAEFSAKVGINYGQLGDNLPSPTESVRLICTKLKAKRVKIYDANPDILSVLRGTDLQVSIMVPNEIIDDIAVNQSLADHWVHSNVRPFYPETKIRYLLVGNEVISSPGNKTWLNLVPAMRRIKKSLKAHRIRKVKVGTSLAMDVLTSSYPPSEGKFRPDIALPIMRPMLEFLNHTKSFLFLDVYPYFAWAADPVHVDLNYTLFESHNITVTDPGTGLVYHNLFDQMVDAVIFASSKLGYPDIRIWIAETGWPNAGDYDQRGANIYNAATYNRNVVRKLTAHPPRGTPARPGRVLPSFIFAMYNEDQKPGPGTERHFGVLYPNGTSVYDIDLSGETTEEEYAKKPLPKPWNDEGYKGEIWCVVGRPREANRTALAAALSYACSQGNGTCGAIQPGKACYKPKSLVRMASYAFSSYWAAFRKDGATCYFDGLATQTIKDPSYGHCKFPSVTL
ncbi:hypothetical protein MLD38_032918 [Melastoma candidum]|uniref:Uncharacterized protein n=1 Tax=Melastoma candidum TaxID=119954 RepID=A0ACB9M580_9MYRT|nr:hypothetical protein MLD38_032918 [Melastoma candidum]